MVPAQKFARNSFPLLFSSVLFAAFLIASCNNTNRTLKGKPEFWVQYKITFKNQLSYNDRLADTAQLGDFLRNYIKEYNQKHGVNLHPVLDWKIADSSHFTVTVNLATSSPNNLNQPLLYTDSTPNCPKPPPTYPDATIDPLCWEIYLNS